MCTHTGDLASRPYSKYLCRVKLVHGAFCMCIHTGDLGSRPYSKYLHRVKSVHGAFCITCVYTRGFTALFEILV